MDDRWQWLPFDGHASVSSVSATLTSSDAHGVTVAAAFPGCMVRLVVAGDTLFCQLGGEGYGHPATIGLPDLPILRRDVEIPWGATVSVRVESVKFTDLTPAELGLERLYPLQPPTPKLQGAEVPFEIDSSFYASTALYPAYPVALGEVYVVRGHRVQPVEFWPVGYNPGTNTIRLYQEIKITIAWTGEDMDQTVLLADRYASPVFEQRLAHQILNYNQGRPPAHSANGTPVGYLIITADSYYSAMLPFADLKSSRGFDVTMTKLSQIPATTNSQIKNYIQNAYDTWPVPPSYVLLVGDTDTIPGWSSVSAGEVTDLYYGTMDGGNDWHPDIGRGRFPVRSATQATQMVDKYLVYANLTGDEPWVKRASFVATCDRWQVAEGTHNYAINSYTQPEGYTGSFPDPNQPGGDKLYCVTYGANLAAMQSSFNAGRAMIIYSGHGSTTGWEVGSYGQANVRALTNGNMYPFVASHACVSGDYAVAEVFGETWVLEPNKGALVFWGSSDSSYWDEDDVLERVMFDTLFAGTKASADVTTMTDAGLAGVEAAYPDSARYYWETYNILGDPAVRVFREPDLPTFTLDVAPTRHEVCVTGSSLATVTVGSVLNYTETVYLSTGLLPGGVSAVLEPSSAPAPFASQLELQVTAGTAAGIYPVVILAADLVDLELDATVHLHVADAYADAPLLTSPANGATNVDFKPTLEWLPSNQASRYDVEIATDPAFTHVVRAETLFGTVYSPADPLDSSTVFFWRVRAQNACGISQFSATRSFGTVALPGDCGPGTVPVLYFQQDFETGEGGWVHSGLGDTWQLSQARPYSGLHSFHAAGVSAASDQRLVSPNIALPAGAQALTLQYWNYQVIESSSGGCFDGGILEISTDDGVSWSQLDTELDTDPYDGLISTSYSNPLGGRNGWCGDPQDWLESIVDVDAYAGQTVRLRFRLGTDSSVGREGWYLDDVSVQSCVPAGPQAGISLRVTVGTDPAACAATDSITLPASGGDVTYCYQVTNTGDLSLALHDVQDSQLGPWLNDMALELEPGASAWVTRTTTVVETTVNQASWTAYNPGPTDIAQSTDQATVIVSLFPPSLVSPPDGTQTGQTSVVLIWAPSLSLGTRGYSVTVDGQTTDVGNVTQHIVSRLVDGIHTWTVAAYDRLHHPSENAPAWSFGVDATAPAVPALISPTKGWIGNDNHPLLVWSAVPDLDVAGYLLQWSGTPIDVGNVTLYDPGVLADGSYGWTVAAYDGLGNASSYAVPNTFTVDTTPPVPPTLTSPADGAQLNYNNPHLLWAISPSSDVSGYRLSWNGTEIELGPVNLYAPGILAEGTYTWTVSAVDRAGNESVVPPLRSFQVDITAPGVPTLVSPADHDVLPGYGVTLIWQSPADADVSGYRVKVNGGVVDVQANQQHALAALTPGVYQWSVAAYDETGNVGLYSGSWSFHVRCRLFLPALVR
jgi:hypothetical protein